MTDARSLVQTKLYRPPEQADFVPRPRLLEWLNAHWESRPLTLISAPAGFGKSVLASMWLKQCDCRSGWVSLDERDDDMRTFLGYMLAALVQAVPNLALETEKMLEAPSLPPVPQLARYLLNDLAQLKAPVALALDDIHRIHEQSIFDFLAELLEHPAPALHLVLVGRHDPPLPVASLRAYQRVTEVRLRHLRFSTAETAALLAKILQRDVEEEIAAAWMEKTEGWAAALHLAALALRHGRETVDVGAAIEGNSRYLHDYLLAEVLGSLTPARQAWLLKTSLLDRFCAPLCEAVCQEEGEARAGEGLNGDAFVAWLRQDNLFLIGLDDRDEWFRFHRLFQENLQAQLRRQASDEEIVRLHRRASAWHGEHGSIDEAIGHALAAGDKDAAVAQVAEHRHRALANGQWNRLEQWIRYFPDDVVVNSPVLAITKAHLPSAYGGEDQFLIGRTRELAATMPAESPVTQGIRGELASLEAMWGIMVGPAAVAIARADEALELLPAKAEYARCAAIVGRAVAFQMSGEYEKGISLIKMATSNPAWSDSSRATMRVGQSWASFFDGDLGASLRAAREGLRLSSRHRQWRMISEANYLAGIVHYLRNEPADAEPYLLALLEEPLLSDPIHIAYGVCALARIYNGQRQRKRAAEMMQRARDHLRDMSNTFALNVLGAFQVELALDEGDIALARRQNLRVDPDFQRVVWYHYVPQLTAIRLMLAEGTRDARDEAQASLAQIGEYARSLNRTSARIDVLALEALAYDAQGERQMAGEKIRAALQLGARGGFIRNYVDLGAPLAGLLRQLQMDDASHGQAETIARILDAFPRDEPGTPAAPNVGRLRPKPPLTKREMQTLRLLTTDLSPREIASEMTITVSTVRTYIKQIYRKLDVQSRYEAVYVAQELDLV